MDDESRFLVGTGKCIRVTDKAILVEIQGRSDKFGFSSAKDMWIPKSVIHDDSEVYGLLQSGKLYVYESWAVKQGL